MVLVPYLYFYIVLTNDGFFSAEFDDCLSGRSDVSGSKKNQTKSTSFFPKRNVHLYIILVQFTDLVLRQ